jgi:Putative transposase, YhgA-like/Domain of unknown function (DUF4351)
MDNAERQIKKQTTSAAKPSDCSPKPQSPPAPPVLSSLAMPAHDNAYKNMFSSPSAVEQLLSGFVHEDWIAHLDFSTLENVNASYVTEDLKGRADDLVWRLRMRSVPTAAEANPTKPKRASKAKAQRLGEWCYVYLMLEFQSRNDPHMAVRMMTYLGLLYQHLIKTRQVGKGKKLPNVFPFVLYNGQRPWTAATDIDDLIEPSPESLKAYRPHLKYFVLDEGRYPEEQLPEDNFVTSIVLAERTTDPRALVKILTPIHRVLELPQNEHAKRAFEIWINGVVIPRIDRLLDRANGNGNGNGNGKTLVSSHPRNTIFPVPELQNMLSEQLDSWERTVASKAALLGEQQGLERGMLLGEQRGMQLGKLEGMLLGEQRGMLLGEQRGMLLGEQRGKLEGKLEAQSHTLRRLLSRRFGVLSPGVSAQIAAAELSQIEAWLDRVLDAGSVADVLMNH